MSTRKKGKMQASKEDSKKNLGQATEKREMVIAVKDFHDSDKLGSGALLFDEGDILTIISKSGKYLWKAENSRGESGYIPVSYVTEVGDKEAQHYPASGQTWSTTSTPARNRGLDSGTSYNEELNIDDLNQVTRTDRVLNNLKKLVGIKNNKPTNKPSNLEQTVLFENCADQNQFDDSKINDCVQTAPVVQQLDCSSQASIAPLSNISPNTEIPQNSQHTEASPEKLKKSRKEVVTKNIFSTDLTIQSSGKYIEPRRNAPIPAARNVIEQKSNKGASAINESSTICNDKSDIKANAPIQSPKNVTLMSLAREKCTLNAGKSEETLGSQSVEKNACGSNNYRNVPVDTVRHHKEFVGDSSDQQQIIEQHNDTTKIQKISESSLKENEGFSGETWNSILNLPNEPSSVESMLAGNNNQLLRVEDSSPNAAPKPSSVVSAGAPPCNQKPYGCEDSSPNVAPKPSSVVSTDAPSCKEKPFGAEDSLPNVAPDQSSSDTGSVGTQLHQDRPADKEGLINVFSPASNLPKFVEESQFQTDDIFIAKGKVFAEKLRKLPENILNYAEAEILKELFQFEIALFLDKSAVVHELHSLNHVSTDDIFVNKGMAIAEILKNLPQDDSRRAAESVLTLLHQFKTGERKVPTDNFPHGYTNSSLRPSERNGEFEHTDTHTNKQPEVFSSHKYRDTGHEDGQVRNRWAKPTDEASTPKYTSLQKSPKIYPSLSPETDKGKDRDSVLEEYSVEQLSQGYIQTTQNSNYKSHVKRRSSKKTFKEPTSSESSYKLLYISIGILIAVVALFFGFLYFYQNQNSFSQVEFTPKPNIPPQIDIDAAMESLKQNFNGQPEMTFKIVKGALRRLNDANPKEPGIVALVAVKGAEDIVRHFARQLAETASPLKDVVTISGQDFSEKDPDVAKKLIDDMLIKNLKENELGGVFIDRLDRIPGEAALIFHTYCDHENAPYKRVLFISTVVSEESKLKSADPKDWDTMFQGHLYKQWDTVGVDQVSSLMSRITVRVAAIVPKVEVSDN